MKVMRPIGRVGLCLVLGLFARVELARAQNLAPPKVSSLPGIEVPADVDLPESGVVQVLVRIDPSGKGVVASCDAGRALCDLVIEGITRAEFEPATRDGHPVASEVRVDLRLRRAETQEPKASESVLEASTPLVEKELVFSQTAEVDARVQAPIRFELEGIRNIPGTFGEPFRICQVLPGMIPVANGQPYCYVRGSPPSGTTYLYDDIPIPLLFHSVVGPATINSALIGSLETFSGAPPARYGGFTGGVMAATAREIPTDRVHGEAELRTIDASGLLNVPMPKEGSMTFGGRFGFPNLLLGAIGVDADIHYWNYQYGTGVAMNPKSRFEMTAFGGRDQSVIDSSDPNERLAFDLQFHRVAARFVAKVKRWDIQSTLLYGYDFSDIEDRSATAFPDAGANLQRIGPRFVAAYGAPKVQVRIGGEMEGIFGPVRCESNALTNVSTPCAPTDPNAPDYDPNFDGQDRRVIGGLFIDTNLSPISWFDLSLGVRADVWKTGGNRDAGVSPRLRATFHAEDIADFFVGWGLGFRPATFAVPLPGLGDIPLEAGLQRANQTEGGVRFFLPRELSFELRGYLNLFTDLRFVDLFTDPEISRDPVAGPIPAGVLDDSADGRSYGLELLFRRPFGAGISTLVSYTLGYNDLTATALLLDGSSQTFDYAPSYDVRHAMNATLAWQADFGLIISARLFARSGRAEGWLWLDPSGVQQYVQRVPWFVRFDAEVAYEWAKPGRRMRISLEWINITQARDAQEVDSSDPSAPFECRVRWGVPSEPCPIKFTQALWYPNLSFRAAF